VGVGRKVLDELERKDQKVLVGFRIAENSILCRHIRSLGWLFGLTHSLFGYSASSLMPNYYFRFLGME